jgi:nitrite reductase (NADH) small subunit
MASCANIIEEQKRRRWLLQFSVAVAVEEENMAETIKIASKSELPAPDEAKEFAAGDRVICVANVGGTLSAMDNVCVHRGGPLGQGIVADGKIVCPWHGWQYDPKSGAASHNPSAKVKVYPLKIEGDDVLIEVE